MRHLNLTHMTYTMYHHLFLRFIRSQNFKLLVQLQRADSSCTFTIMSSATRTMLSIRRAILQAPPRSSQTYNGFLGVVPLTSVFNRLNVRTIKEASGDMLGGVGDTAKPAMGGTSETGRSTTVSTGEKAMHTADKTSAAKTTKHISDRMIHEAEDKLDEETNHQPTDSSVEDLRTREKGYD